MTKTQVEVITPVQRRRRWPRTEKERIVAATMEPGAVASDVARASGIHASQLFRGRQQLSERTQIPAVFDPVVASQSPKWPRRCCQRRPASSRSSLPAAGECGYPGQLMRRRYRR
jgi:transposase